MIRILKTTPDYLICEKPPRLLCEAGSPDSLPDALSLQLCEAGEPGAVFPVHRLDRGVGGIMVYARNRETAAFLCQQVSDKTMGKIYTAVVRGCPQPEEGEMHDLLFRDARRGKTFVVDRKRAGVRDAALCYRVLSYDPACGRALVSIRLFTGRTHQIRAQFSSRQHPLCGDRRYGGEAVLGAEAGAIALRCTALSFRGRDGKTVTYLDTPNFSPYWPSDRLNEEMSAALSPESTPASSETPF